MLMFLGYTLILVLDKVLFDPHMLFEHQDPAAVKLQVNLTNSMIKAQSVDTNDPAAVKRSMAEQKDEVDAAMKSYNTPTDRFAERMRASLKGNS